MGAVGGTRLKLSPRPARILRGAAPRAPPKNKRRSTVGAERESRVGAATRGGGDDGDGGAGGSGGPVAETWAQHAAGPAVPAARRAVGLGAAGPSTPGWTDGQADASPSSFMYSSKPLLSTKRHLPTSC